MISSNKALSKVNGIIPADSKRSTVFVVAAGVLLVVSGLATAGAQEPSYEADATVGNLVEAIAPAPLRTLVAAVLANNPDLASHRSRAEAARLEAPQAAALPDPVAALTAYLQTPETRVGPQRLMMSLSQRLPWFGTLSLRQQAVLADAAAAHGRVEAAALALVTETRRLVWELAFLDRWAQIAREDRDALSHYEDVARARYASGAGNDQPVVKLQAEITRASNRLLEIALRRAALAAQLNALRAQPAVTPLPPIDPPLPSTPLPAAYELRSAALAMRPELAASAFEIAAAEARIELARKRAFPDVTLGLTYGLMSRRDDAAGLANPPADNGQDMLGATAAVTLPVHGKAIRAGIEQAVQRRLAAQEARRAVLVAIDRDLGDLGQRITLLREQLELYTTLHLQARESLRTAESGYAAGTSAALDLLDAERVLLEIRKAQARSEADLGIALATLDGTVGTTVAARPQQ